MKALLTALALLAELIGHDVKSITPYKYTADGRTAYGITVDYSDGTYVFYDRIIDACVPPGDAVHGIVVETFHRRDWTGYYRVMTETGTLVTVSEDPEDITSADAVTLYYTDGQLTDVLVGHR